MENRKPRGILRLMEMAMFAAIGIMFSAIVFRIATYDEVRGGVYEKIKARLSSIEVEYMAQVFDKQKRLNEREGYGTCTSSGSVEGCKDFITSIVAQIKTESEKYYKNKENLPKDYVIRQI